jgi:ribosomal protein S27E
MDRTFTCPDCGHETAYLPGECQRFVRFKPDGTLGEDRYLLVRCAGCGREHEVPDEPG